MIKLLTKKDYDHKRGGVPIHTEYLKKVFPDAIHITVDKMLIAEGPLDKMAMTLGNLAVSTSLIEPEDIVITDGFWAIGVPDKSRIISVCHGTLAGVVGVNHMLAKLQAKAMDGTHVVSVSEHAAKECLRYYGIKSTVILNCVDLNVFQPGCYRQKLVAMIENKGKRYTHQSVINDLTSQANYKFRKISGNWPDDIVSGLKNCTSYLHLSDYEGNSYAVLEAMACGLPVVGSRVGLFADYETDFLTRYKIPVGEMVSRHPTVEEIENALHKIYDNYDYYQPREFCKKYSSINVFSSEWKAYVKKII